MRQVKQSLVGLHKKVMSLSTLRTHSRDDAQQICVSRAAQIFLSSVPNGVLNLLSSFISLKEFGRLHQVIQANKQCKAHCERNLCQYAHYAKPLFNTFTSIEAQRWTL